MFIVSLQNMPTWCAFAERKTQCTHWDSSMILATLPFKGLGSSTHFCIELSYNQMYRCLWQLLLWISNDIKSRECQVCNLLLLLPEVNALKLLKNELIKLTWILSHWKKMHWDINLQWIVFVQWGQTKLSPRVEHILTDFMQAHY